MTLQTPRPATRRLAILGLALALVSGGMSVAAESQTFIEPGRTFLLGGEQTQAMRIDGLNLGTVPVDLLLQADGQERRVGTAAPGEAFTIDLPARTVAMARNVGSVRAVVRLRFEGRVDRLSMRYDRP